MLTNQGLAGTTLETQVSPGNSGTSAAQLKTQNIMFVGNVPGVVASGPISLNGQTLIIKGAPFTGVPTDFTFYYKNAPVNGDTAVAEALFTKWNTTTNSRDTLAYGAGLYTNSVSAFTLATVPIVWFAAGTPDTCVMLFTYSIGGAPQVNSTFTIDDVMMVYPTGVSEPFMGNYSLYPNPANDVVNIVTKDVAADKVMIYDLTGRKVATETFNDKKAVINTALFAEGLYIYRIYDAKGNELKNSKFTVAR
jgi:hypothetical protein